AEFGFGPTAAESSAPSPRRGGGADVCPRVPSSTAPSEGRRDVERGSPAEVPESSSQSPGPPLQAVPELAGEHSRLLTGGPVAFRSEERRVGKECRCWWSRRRVYEQK